MLIKNIWRKMRTTWMRKFKPESIIRANHCSLSLVEGTESLRPRWSKAELNFWIMCIALPWCHHQLGSRTRFLSLLSFFLMESGRDRQPESGEEKKKKKCCLSGELTPRKRDQGKSISLLCGFPRHIIDADNITVHSRRKKNHPVPTFPVS